MALRAEDAVEERPASALGKLALCVVALTVSAGAVLSNGQAAASTATASAPLLMRLDETGGKTLSTDYLQMNNQYERDTGRRVGEGYPFDFVAEIYRATRFEIDEFSTSSSLSYQWSMDDGKSYYEGRSIEHTFIKLGQHEVALSLYASADAAAADGAGTSVVDAAMGRRLAAADALQTMTVTVTCKYVRRNLYNLDKADREKFLDSLKLVYTVGGDEGRRRYGAKFVSIEELVAMHLEGAADKECDHWHDDAGFMTHHVAFTLYLEQALQTIDANLTVPYWDYTEDEYDVGDWTKSALFADSWFGAASPQNHEHVISEGRWAFTPVAKLAANYTKVHNPYGLLRSPWNTNPTPYLTRYRYTVGSKDAGYKLPSCKRFAHVYDSMWIGEINMYLNGLLHGPIHIMLGGHWDFNTTIDSGAQSLLLSAKALWRQGYLRCPDYCSDDTPAAECTCSCPASMQHDVFGAKMSAKEVLKSTGLLTWNSMFVDSWRNATDDRSYQEVLDMICHVGHAGEMFTSAAPYDPMFWPLHGVADRFLALKRLRYYESDTYLEETWGYDHALLNVASDTHLVCDWSKVDGGHKEMPACEKGTCSGHKADDLLPVGNFLDTGDTYSNYDFYEFMSPDNADFPYVYDSLTHWPGCAAQKIHFGASDSNDDDHKSGTSADDDDDGSAENPTPSLLADGLEPLEVRQARYRAVMSS